MCLLFADDAVFLTSLEFELELFGAESDALGVRVRTKAHYTGKII